MLIPEEDVQSIFSLQKAHLQGHQTIAMHVLALMQF